MRHDIISDVLSAIKNGERIGKSEVVTPASNLTKAILLIFQKEGFIGNFEFIDDGRGGKFKIQLLGKINNCNSIRPRFSVKADQYEKWERRFLPASGFGILIISTSKGALSHKVARKKRLGGKLLAFVY